MLSVLAQRNKLAPVPPRGPAGIGLAPDHEWSGTSIRFKQPNGTWGAYTNLLGAEGPNGTAQTFNTYAIAAASIISAGVEAIRLLGYYAAGGGGAATYKEVVALPSHGGKITTADGRFWEICEPFLEVRMFGAKGDGVESSGVWSGTDVTTAISAMRTAAAALDVPCGIRTRGNYITGAQAFTDLDAFIMSPKAQLVPLTGAFTATSFQNEYDPAHAYSVGDSICFSTTAATISAGLTPDGLVYRCIQAGTNKTPSTQPAYWTVVAFVDWISFTGLADTVIEGLSVNISGTKYPQVRAIDVVTGSKVTLRGANVSNAGGYGISLTNCVNCRLEDPYVGSFALHGIYVVGTTTADSVNNVVVDANVITTTIGIGHGLAFINGTDQNVEGGKFFGARTFGLNFSNIVGGGAVSPTTRNTVREGINVSGGTDIIITSPRVFCDGTHNDFGISVDGTTETCTAVVFSDPIVSGSYSSGICFTGTVILSKILGGEIRNCNVAGAAHHGGILFSGTACQENTVEGITIYDSRTPKKHDYAYLEFDSGNGTPSNNTWRDINASGWITNENLLSTSSGQRAKVSQFDLSGGSNQAYTASSAAKILLVTTAFISGCTFASNRVTITRAGLYGISAQVSVTASTDAGYIIGYIYKNGAAVVQAVEQAGTAAALSVEVKKTIQLIAGDYIELFFSSGNNQTINASAAVTWLELRFIEP